MLVQILFIIGVIYAKGTIQKLEQNEYRILNQIVINRANYFQEDMIKWMQLEPAITAINRMAENYALSNPERLQNLEKDDTLYTALLGEACPELIELMRRNGVNGVFLILSTTPLETASNSKPGIYLRDLDSFSVSPENNEDLLAKRIPAEVARNMNIAYDADWSPVFHFDETQAYYDFFQIPYEEALRREDWKSSDLGYWSSIFTLSGDKQKVLAYSVPLKLEDGTVYGVLGIDITVEHIRKILDYQELNERAAGEYVLGIRTKENQVNCLVSNGSDKRLWCQQSSFPLSQNRKSKNLEDVWYIDMQNMRTAYAGIRTLQIYDSNSPFAQEWVLCGIVDAKELLAFSRQMDELLRGITILCIMGGILIVGFVTMVISRPILEMVQAVRNSNPRGSVKLPSTNVKELNELGKAIEQFSEDASDLSTKFDQIIKMASAELAGFEINEETDAIYVSDGFFGMFGRGNIKENTVDPKKFSECLNELSGNVIKREEGELLYELERDGEKIWIRLRIGRKQEKWYGLAENVTKEILEIRKVEYERDYDMLTNLLNRRAFRDRCINVLKQGEQFLRYGAMVMIDLDNLKLLNDNYGHEWGDHYIRLAAQSIKNYLPKDALTARMSGDEFLAFLYGYPSRETIEMILKELELHLSEQYLTLPDKHDYKLRLSGGTAWYPEDAQEFSLLVKYADFAMYKVKNSVKGRFCNFDKKSYLTEYYLLQNKEELNKLLEQQLVEYYFQPIIEVKTGKIYAYEALMRSTLETIASIEEILTLAKQDFKLDQIEKLTWFKAMGAFMKLRLDGLVEPDCKVFINSIPNQILSGEDCNAFEKLYGDGLSLIVAEVTEEEKMNLEVQENKNRLIRKWKGQIAIDDYGTGYNGQSVLIKTSPEYIKIDMGFVRDVHKDEKKQMMIHNAVSYAHDQKILVIAEGVEYKEEVKELLDLGVDYLQGYYYARPAAIPQTVDKEKLRDLTGDYYKRIISSS